jgi:hypothetical protein
VPDEIFRILLDQNIPQAISGWLKAKLPDWQIQREHYQFVNKKTRSK